MEHEVRFNKTFLIDGGQKYNLTNYLSISATDFEQNFANNQAEYRAEIEKNYDYNEKTNTRPLIFLLRRNSMAGLQQAFEEIHLAQKEKRLTQPLKAFFGFNRRLIESSKNPYILAFDKNKINIDQIRVVYNSMVNRITYVQGPPGTGKTETIFNVLLTAFANDKKCLVCSNNNFPIDGIFEKMRNSFIYQRTLNSEKEKFYFPIIRIGNAEENIKAIRYLKEILNFVDRTAYLRVSEKRTLNSKFDSLAVYDSLRSDLKDYEKRKEIEQLLKSLKRWKDNAKNPYLEKMLNEQIEFKDKELLSIKEISNEDIQNNVVSSADSPDFMNYLFYASLRMLRRLLSPSNKQLKSIIEEEDEEEAAKKLVSYLKEDENVKRFTNIFPIVVTTNLSATKLGSPKQHFHLCIMDEAGQCNMASAILSIIRADDLLLVGDLNQLQPVTVLDRHLNTKLMEKYQVSSAYNYIDNSILKLMQTKDENSKKIFLRYHYRCGKKIIGFSNSRFYDNQLFLENLNDGNLYYKNVPSSRRLNAETNTALLEAEKIVEIIKTNKYDDVAIVTPFRNQAKLINSKLSEKGILNVTAGTIHTVQGTEKNTIIFSAAISLKTAARTMEWIKNNQELINVANTRAKKNLIFVGDRQAIDLKCGKEDSHLKSFSDSIARSANYVDAPSSLMFKSDFSNDSRSEEVFFETISHYFEHRSAKFRAERNVLIKNMIKNLTREDKKIIGLREVDVLISIKTTLYGNYTPILVFEVDGGEHIGRTKTYKSDRLKENICKKYGIKTIRIPNSQVKNYELIISLFKMDIRNTENNQMSLFDDF